MKPLIKKQLPYSTNIQLKICAIVLQWKLWALHLYPSVWNPGTILFFLCERCRYHRGRSCSTELQYLARTVSRWNLSSSVHYPAVWSPILKCCIILRLYKFFRSLLIGVNSLHYHKKCRCLFEIKVVLRVICRFSLDKRGVWPDHQITVITHIYTDAVVSI